jgi:hydrogenase/urease accessory protein HupE
MATKRLAKREDNRRIGLCVFCALLWLTCSSGFAHEINTTYLELRENADQTCGILLRIPELGTPLQIHFPVGTEIISQPIERTIDGAQLSTWSVQLSDPLAGAALRIEGLAMNDLIVRAELKDGSEQTLRLSPGETLAILETSPSQLKVAGTYFQLGVGHILSGIDHLLFVLALLLLIHGWKKLLGAITTFTVAHSITLALATLGFVHVPGPPVEAIIALSIVFVALELVHSKQGKPGITERAPWIVTLLFGLLHGLGFAGALSEVGLPSTAIPMALLFFNLGVEAGQLLFVAFILLILNLFARFRFPRFGWARLIPSYVIGCIAMFWVIERVAAF